MVGGYATITNVSKEEYGEGDFTKGVYVWVPFQSLLVWPDTQPCGDWLDAADA
ncbi:YjbH domain-containing protein [Escherichia coli]